MCNRQFRNTEVPCVTLRGEAFVIKSWPGVEGYRYVKKILVYLYSLEADVESAVALFGNDDFSFDEALKMMCLSLNVEAETLRTLPFGEFVEIYIGILNFHLNIIKDAQEKTLQETLPVEEKSTVRRGKAKVTRAAEFRQRKLKFHKIERPQNPLFTLSAC